MPEIIPNWHPAVVHFPIALAITATVLLLAGRLRPAIMLLPACGRLLLQLSAPSAVVAAALGWYAFQAVEHDAAGHLVMLRHRNWALASAAGLLLLVLSGSLGFTGWLGGEMVYRHGIGVSSATLVSPAAAVDAVPQAAPETPLPASSVSAVMPGEHVHKDGKRHRH